MALRSTVRGASPITRSMNSKLGGKLINAALLERETRDEDRFQSAL